MHKGFRNLEGSLILGLISSFSGSAGVWGFLMKGKKGTFWKYWWIWRLGGDTWALYHLRRGERELVQERIEHLENYPVLWIMMDVEGKQLAELLTLGLCPRYLNEALCCLMKCKRIQTKGKTKGKSLNLFGVL